MINSKVKRGCVFGKLIVIKRIGNSSTGKKRWLCRCECGRECRFTYQRLIKNGSCGCIIKEKSDRKNHGLSGNYLYHIWAGMIHRCYSEKNSAYHDYGGRGITVCDEWRFSVHKFMEDMGDRPTDGHSIDRIDVNGNYEPENCRWATRSEQELNKRPRVHKPKIEIDKIVIEYNGKTQTAMQWAKEIGISCKAMKHRVKRWPIDRVIETPRDPVWETKWRD